jgi:phosphoribosylaminoimidazolecarboxamide formyltransferase/IMP cyclohydrolase
VFEHTAAYDALIAGYLRRQNGGGYPDKLTLTYEKKQDMRYGENPHQTAAFYSEPLATEGTLAAAEQLWGKELSFNNINDTNGALDCLREFDEITVVASKHANPCGVGSAETLHEAYMKAYEADPVSIYGGIVAVNATVDKTTAEEMVKIFLEIIIAPDYTDEALKVLQSKKNLRIMRLPNITARIKDTAVDIKKPLGGLLVQQPDSKLFDGELKVVTKRQPTQKELADMTFAWKLVKHIKSNGISVAKDKKSLGLGPGQVSRIWAAENALVRAGEEAAGAAMASDAFFPFDDVVRLAAKYGITSIIQPGGSIHDEDSIKACDELGIAMVFTGIRHFRH